MRKYTALLLCKGLFIVMLHARNKGPNIYPPRNRRYNSHSLYLGLAVKTVSGLFKHSVFSVFLNQDETGQAVKMCCTTACLSCSVLSFSPSPGWVKGKVRKPESI